MAMIDLIIKLLFAGVIIVLAYALDGELVFPFRRLKCEELRILRWMKKLRHTSNSKTKRRSDI